ncbi:MAG TPA: hypothetical protein VKX30_08015 [Flavobacteriaceae bacterium]|nr:hypothetical protein [Flavobacteriaceae bacterium]
MFKKTTLLLLLFTLSTSLLAQIKVDDFEDAKEHFDYFFSEGSTLDEDGNAYIDMGTFSDGRFSVLMTDVDLQMEERGEEPGCADICPPSVFITFNCRESKCLKDPLISDTLFEASSLVFFDTSRGKKAYEYLRALQDFLRKTIN